MSPPCTDEDLPQTLAKKLRMACNACHQAKIKCSGGTPCTGCARARHECIHSQSKPTGRPKGTRNTRKADQSVKETPPGQEPQAEEGGARQRDSDTNINSRNINDRNWNRTLPGLHSRGVASMSPSHYQNQEWMNVQPGSPLAFDFDTSSDNLDWPISFQMQATGDQMYFFDHPLNFDASLNVSAFDLTGNTVVQDSLHVDVPAATASIPNQRPLPQGPSYSSSTFQTLPMLPTRDRTQCSEDDESNNSSEVQISSSGASQLFTNAYPDTAPIRRSSTTNSLPISQKGTRDATFDASNLEIQIPSPDSSAQTTPTSSSSSHSSSCLCLQHHAKLLVRLKDLWRGSKAAPIDVVLNGVQQALTPWNYYIQCRVCQLDEDQEVLTLSAMSIRAVLRLLQSAYRVISPPLDTEPRQLKRKRNGTLGSTKFALGSYEITGEERMLVLELLLSKTLSKIQLVLGCLRKKSSRHPGSDPLNVRHKDREMDLGHLQALLQHLEATVQMLSADLAK